MASINLLLTIICLTCYTLVAIASPKKTLRILTIAAEPALLPYSPTSAASAPAYDALSPDVTPLFPTPASGASPDSSLPVIPSSPSPPNPESLATPHPELSIAPSGSMPESSVLALDTSVSFNLGLLGLVFIAFW